MDYDILMKEIVRIRVLLQQLVGDKMDKIPVNISTAPRVSKPIKVVKPTQKSGIKRKRK